MHSSLIKPVTQRHIVVPKHMNCIDGYGAVLLEDGCAIHRNIDGSYTLYTCFSDVSKHVKIGSFIERMARQRGRDKDDQKMITAQYIRDAISLQKKVSKPALAVEIRIDLESSACMAAWYQENVIVDNTYDFETFDAAMNTHGHTQRGNALMLYKVAGFIDRLCNPTMRKREKKKPRNADTRHEIHSAYIVNHCIIAANNVLAHYCHTGGIPLLARNIHRGHVAIAQQKDMAIYQTFFNASARDYVGFVNTWQLVTNGSAFTLAELEKIAKELSSKK